MTVSVVLADDQSVVRAGLTTILAPHDDLAVVAEAADGYEAIEAVLRLDPDVVLMDVRMPRLDGVAATRELVDRGVRTRICVLTTYGLEDVVHDALAAGASGFLLKTDPPERIVSALRRLAEGEPVLSPATVEQIVAKYVSAPRPAPVDLVEVLTQRERSVYLLVARGLTNREIAGELSLGEGTVKSHVAHLLTKLGLRDRIQVVIHAHRHGLV
ncbi:response regulator [Longivirga aurantiaca]|uniref:Response regulator n=1 Tax=Longivirga aurantiaca TaxID=1837743 RepID=A0ABW1SYX2_9ACTN